LESFFPEESAPILQDSDSMPSDLVFRTESEALSGDHRDRTIPSSAQVRSSASSAFDVSLIHDSRNLYSYPELGHLGARARLPAKQQVESQQVGELLG
jgi:hypothetical protein